VGHPASEKSVYREGRKETRETHNENIFTTGDTEGSESLGVQCENPHPTQRARKGGAPGKEKPRRTQRNA
jgi:hypothetical protein